MNLTPRLTQDELKSNDDINRLYDTNFESCQFTNFELLLFNGKINLLNVCEYKDNIDKIRSLSKYFDVKNDYKNYLKCTNILLEANDLRGYLNLGVYLWEKEKYDESLKVFLVGASKGDIQCIMNTGLYYDQKNDLDNALKYYLFALKKNQYEIIPRIAKIYACKNDILNMCKYLLYGIMHNNEKCMEILEMEFPSSDIFYVILLKQPNTSELIQKKIRELNKTIDVENVNDLMRRGIILSLNNDKIFTTEEFELIYEFPNDNDNDNDVLNQNTNTSELVQELSNIITDAINTEPTEKKN